MLKSSIVLLSLLTFVVSAKSFAQEAEQTDQTLAPYFFVRSDDPSVDALPLKATSAQVEIAGVIADVKVRQEYKNEGAKPLEAIYTFPGSTRAAVYGLKMTIGARTIVAKIEKRAEARQQYEQARQEGKSASLLEQQRPNVFQMNVANIMPGDVIVVEMSYTELLTPTDGVYEFVYPTVVGPRYVSPDATQAEWTQNPYLHEGDAPTYAFGLSVRLSAGLPLQSVASPSHHINITYSETTLATVTLADDETSAGNRDFILQYQLAGARIDSGLMLYQGETENFFLLMAQPPKNTQAADIPPREYIFIVDVSGSMNGFPLEIAKQLLNDLIGKLAPSEKFNVLLFAGGSAVLAEQESLAATPENIAQALRFINDQQGGGGTEILPALQRALALPRVDGMARTIVIATDGYIAVEPQVFDLIRAQLGDANLFAFGIGTSVNRLLIEGMARMGMGEPFVITDPAAAPAQAEKFRQYIQAPVLTQAKLTMEGFETYEVEPLSIPDVLAERPVIVFGKWRGAAQGALTLSGVTGHAAYTQRFDVGAVTPRAENAALRYLWARHRIQVLGDYNALQPDDERVEAITDLGLQYNLLTAYTSFVAIDSEIRNTTGAQTTVNQPLPLPEGVSDMAVGKGMLQNSAPASRALEAVKPMGPAPEQKRDKRAEPFPTTSEPDSAKDEAPVKTQRVDAKTFELRDGVWVDTAYAPEKELIKIARDSQAYRDLLAALPELQAYCDLGPQVLVSVGKYAIAIGAEGKSELTVDELQALVEAFRQG